MDNNSIIEADTERLAKQWHEETRRLSDIRPFERNPRTITESQFDKLKASLIEHGQFRPLLVTADMRLAGGHQRLRAMRELGWETCRVSVPDYHVTDDEYMRLIMRDNINNGLFDWDEVANAFDLEECRAFGLQEVGNIAPEGRGETDGVWKVKCPKCSECFPVKGNRA